MIYKGGKLWPAYFSHKKMAQNVDRVSSTGVFAPNSKHRAQVVPKREPREKTSDKPLAPMTWMQRLKRVFAIDIETCPKCGGKLRTIACIEDPDVIATILEHIRTREAAAPSQPRAPPRHADHLGPTNQHRLF